MRGLVSYVFVFLFSTLLVLQLSAKPKAESPDKAETLTVFLTGNVLGELQPCGCSSGQLGGFDRRATILQSVCASKRMIIDTGGFVNDDNEQDIIKFGIIIEALSLLGYDLVNITRHDIETGESFGLVPVAKSVLSVISSQQLEDANIPAVFSKEFSLNSKSLKVTVAAFDVQSGPIDKIGELFAEQSDGYRANLLIINECDPNTISSIGSMGIADCIICPSEEDDEPVMISKGNKRPLVFTVGRKGRYVCRLTIRAEKNGGLTFKFYAEEVHEKLKRQAELVGLYKDYQLFVKEANLLEDYPRVDLPDGLKYVGSKQCKFCHEYEYEKWSSKKHSIAYKTLEDVNSQYDPECVKCHVVGMDYTSGFLSEKSPKDLRNVGCENCHGPCSEHIKDPEKVITKTIEPRSACADCHTTDHSRYSGHEEEYFQKIIHWKEPKITDRVKRNSQAKD